MRPNSALKIAGVAAGVGLTFVGVGLLALWGLVWLLGWQLDIVSAHAGFFQAWIYILQTFALVATLVYIGVQAGALERSVVANTVQMMVGSHRDLLGKLIERPELSRALGAAQLPGDSASQVYMSMMFNHGFNAFSLREAGYIDDEWWVATVEDMRDIIRRGAMKEWWGRIRRFYPPRYQNFIDREILAGEGK